MQPTGTTASIGVVSTFERITTKIVFSGFFYDLIHLSNNGLVSFAQFSNL